MTVSRRVIENTKFQCDCLFILSPVADKATLKLNLYRSLTSLLEEGNRVPALFTLSDRLTKAPLVSNKQSISTYKLLVGGV